MATAVPFYSGAYCAIDLFLGTLILFIWERIISIRDAEEYAGAVASGLICCDGIWTVASAKINPPIYIFFRPALSG